MNAAKLTLAILLLSSTAALADPQFGRRMSETMQYSEVGILAAQGEQGDLPRYFPKYASADDKRLVKAMGDAMLLAPRGEKRVAVGRTTWTRGIKSDARIIPRPVSFVFHTGAGIDDGTIMPPKGLTAKVEFCRGIWASYVAGYELTMDMVHPRLNQLVHDATPYLNSQIGERYSYSVSQIFACKLAGSSEWAFIRGGTAHGGDRWVFVGRYTPSKDTHPSVEVRTIPNHLRDAEAKAAGAAWAAPPVNKYDAALLPTPGDSSGMMDIGGSSAPTSAATVRYSVEQARAILMSRPVRKGAVTFSFQPDGTTVTRNAAGQERGRETWSLATNADGQPFLITGANNERWSAEETADLLRRIQQGTGQ